MIKDVLKAEEGLSLRVLDPDFLCCSGSRLYGTYREDSDYDYRGYLVPPFEYLIGNKKFECQEIPGSDHKVYSLKRFLELALKGDPLIVESFFVPEDKIIKRSKLSDIIIGLKDDIVSNVIYSRIVGYSHSEWRKAMGEKIVLEKRERTEDTVINDIREIFKPSKEQMDSIIKTLYEDRELKIIPSKKGIGGKRKKEFDRYGYGVSSAAHSIRLLGQVWELMMKGTLTFPRQNADLLKDIRYGKVTKKRVESIYTKNRIMVEAARDASVLRDKPNRKKVWETYLEVVSILLMRDDRFANFLRYTEEEIKCLTKEKI